MLVLLGALRGFLAVAAGDPHPKIFQHGDLRSDSAECDKSRGSWSTLEGKVAASNHRSACVWVSLLVALGCASVACAAGLDPVIRPTVAGMSEAHRALVTGGELGSSWIQGLAFKPSTTAIPCASLEPNESRLVETGVGGTTFASGPWLNVTAATRVFATPAQAEDSWRQTDVLALVQC